jgi:alcohol dehydrogenase
MLGPLGGLATHCHLLADTAVVKVPSELPDAVAAPASCATATVAAAWRVARARSSPTLPQTVVVLGLGMLGLTACAWAAIDGHTVVACDVSTDRSLQAGRFGPTHAVKPPDVVELVQSLTEGRGADLGFEMSGSPAAAKLSLDVLRIGGTAVWVGAVSPTDPVSVHPETIVRRCLTVTGIHNYAPRDLAAAVAFLANHHTRFPFAELVTRTFPLHDATAAFHFAEAEHSVRVAVAPDLTHGL